MERPVPPPCRILHEGLFHYRWFTSSAEYDKWKKRSWWRKFCK